MRHTNSANITTHAQTNFLSVGLFLKMMNLVCTKIKEFYPNFPDNDNMVLLGTFAWVSVTVEKEILIHVALNK